MRGIYRMEPNKNRKSEDPPMPPLQSRPRPRPAVRSPDSFPPATVRVCPECAGPLVRASGCVSCRHCGWGRCG
jgi:hypothetical protein